MFETGFLILALDYFTIGLVAILMHIVLGRMLVDRPDLVAWVLSLGGEGAGS